ncbi:hypothetical protein ACLDXX_12315 [Acinetobacter baumannii]
MDNYKIKVKDEAESKEAQELFFELGYSWQGCGKYYNRIGNYAFITAYPDEMLLRMGWGGDTDKELLLPQLRDLVVLKRNDVSDANYRSKSVLDGFYFKSCDGVFYFMFEGKWVRSTTNTDEGLEPITKDPALISGAEAHQALLAGENVQYSGYGEQYWDTALNCNIGVFLNHEKFPDFKFRIVPRTIKVELELPKPFEPEEDCHVYILDDGKTDGYRRYSYEVHGDKGNTFIGIWRTEEEIKQVVEQLRKIRGAS